MPDTTETTRTPFPERMRATAVESHTRRAIKALSDLMERAAILRDRLQAFQSADADYANTLAEMAVQAAVHLSALEVLRDVREWDEAERNARP
jgi:hypothetical protein